MVAVWLPQDARSQRASQPPAQHLCANLLLCGVGAVFGRQGGCAEVAFTLAIDQHIIWAIGLAFRNQQHQAGQHIKQQTLTARQSGLWSYFIQ
jgi:hypothetical protein